MSAETVPKDPASDIDYGFNWGPSDGNPNDGSADDDGWLQGAVIATSTWRVEGPDSLLVVLNEANDDTNTSVIVRGGTEGIRYRLINTITTINLKEEWSLVIDMGQN